MSPENRAPQKTIIFDLGLSGSGETSFVNFLNENASPLSEKIYLATQDKNFADIVAILKSAREYKAETLQDALKPAFTQLIENFQNSPQTHALFFAPDIFDNNIAHDTQRGFKPLIKNIMALSKLSTELAITANFFIFTYPISLWGSQSYNALTKAKKTTLPYQNWWALSGESGNWTTIWAPVAKELENNFEAFEFTPSTSQKRGGFILTQCGLSAKDIAALDYQNACPKLDDSLATSETAPRYLYLGSLQVERKVAHMASFPPRVETCKLALQSLSPQVDEVRLVLNEFEDVPEALKGFDNVDYILPTEDQKDVGKFFIEPAPYEWVAFADDDIIYHENYFNDSLDQIAWLGLEKAIYGFHGSLYRVSRIRQNDMARRIYRFSKRYPEPLHVDQLGTGTVIAHASCVPSYEYMKTSQKFVDIRYSKWCHENGIERILLAHPDYTMKAIPPQMTEAPSIYHAFTSQEPEHLFPELKVFVRHKKTRGKPVRPQLNTHEITEDNITEDTTMEETNHG